MPRIDPLLFHLTLDAASAEDQLKLVYSIRSDLRDMLKDQYGRIIHRLIEAVRKKADSNGKSVDEVLLDMTMNGSENLSLLAICATLDLIESESNSNA